MCGMLYDGFIKMFNGFRHHGEPTSSLQYRTSSEPQWICAPWHWETSISYKTSFYKYTYWNWGKMTVAYPYFSFHMHLLFILCWVIVLYREIIDF